ncbi:DUF1488 family protein [Burkholderia sp. TSV86]|uniref:DUF1488 family protein n=1 Tax=Burkholderia sp. TSV86 TaxID=1385594 RepID=UPI003FA42ADD
MEIGGAHERAGCAARTGEALPRNPPRDAMPSAHADIASFRAFDDRGLDPSPSFPVLVDGCRVQCVITAEALEEHLRVASPREQDLMDAFMRQRPAIECVARCKLEEMGGWSGYFRFCR